jgi:integrase/recombinase XerD
MVRPLLERAMLGSLATTRSPVLHHVLFLVSLTAGLRAQALASLTWAMVTDAQGQGAEVRHVSKEASSKGALQHAFAGARARLVAG